jgi:Leucine-rich repeat (LRR) protein
MNNQLSTIPKNIGNLKSLRVLSFRNNQIQSIPDSIQNLSNLLYLDLRGNQIKELPDLSGLKKLEKVDLRWNPNLSVTPSLLQLKEQSCLLYY